VLSAKSHARLKVAMKAAKYYEMVSRPLTPQNMSWSPCLKDFAEHWDALTQRKENEDPQVPKITKTLQVMQWAEAFSDFLHRKVGIRSIPLAYVTRPEIAVAEPAPPLAENRSYSTGDDGHGSVEGELIARASHSHAKFRDDNASVYYFVEEATRGTTYSGSIAPFQRKRDGRGAMITSQYAGRDKWDAELKRKDELLHTYRIFVLRCTITIPTARSSVAMPRSSNSHRRSSA
jgi:hypothetical protein